ncbi:uncharacterized protein HMPREF1541_08091 [Cyphellophora europaea CBS 101466]|uniref:Autophagy-related protein 14 n=1 Tax=Cyphellophora europaea (strain CBS 101466) TaxID=1220924 RepID=W2RKT8_CYPE1|nr:uncharacterized protein HMPREF1541_08091 [Cyphellophora europaea CBS 101466]ETN37101.1 hypothetical protein HMPREF1541_08091 [Cyphellophora europaea CBS 101466]
MECDICARKGSDLTQVGLHCASCARTALYAPRLEQGRILLEKASLNSKIETSTRSDGALEGGRSLPQIWKTEVSRIKASDVRDRLQQEQRSITLLREDIARMKDEVSRKRMQLESDWAELKTVRTTLAGQDKGHTDKLNESTAKGLKNFNSMHEASVETRAYLCREAATLLRLRQRKTRRSDQVREHYLIAGWQIPDLRSISNCKCTEVTAMLATYSHLLCLVAFYLGVRLPAEITLPRRDYPLATVNTPSTSYTSAKIEFPGSGSFLAMTELSKRNETKGASRPRPLFTGSDDKDELISHVAKRDPSAFKFFVEGISLLAWNVSWLCHSQGFSIGTESWTDACDIGHNLWQLIFAPNRSPALLRAISSRDPRQRQTSRISTPPADLASGQLGGFSHASAHSFLGSSTRSSHIRALRLSKYNMISDPLRKLLENEMKNLEWEVLGQDEILDGAETFDEAVVVRARAMDGKGYNDTRSIVTTKAHHEDQSNNRPKGTSGWTKVKEKNRE